MKKDLKVVQRRQGLWLSLLSLGLIGALVCTLPLFSGTRAAVNNGDSEDIQITRSHQPGFENYDVRQDKTAKEKLESFRAASGKDVLSISNELQKMRSGEERLRRRVPTLQVEYNSNLDNAEVIAPDVKKGRAFLTSARQRADKNAETLRHFVKDNSELIGFSVAQADDLIVTADYTNPNGILSFASLEQRINGVPVFLGEVKAGFDRDGRMFRVINNLAPGLEYQSLSSDFGDPAEAVKSAFKNVPREFNTADLALNAAASTDLKVKFGADDWATTAEKMYFPTEPGVARAAWRILEWEPVAAYLVIVDAETGTLLWRKNITEDQTQSATYNVYANSTSLVKALDNPTPITPGPINPGLGTQGTQVARTDVTLIGNEAPNTFNNLGWITDTGAGVNAVTDGNAVEAGLDIDGVNGVDAPVAGAGRVFSFNYNPAPGLPPPPDSITSTQFRNGAVTQLFYYNNRFHDELYKLGFTEAAGNFQNDNFGRGGIAGDRVSAEAQDSSGTNNANFSVTPDGVRGRMQMYRFTQSPARDGDLDGDVVLHEHTHGLSNRLHGNGSGLSSDVSRSMGEGWSDFYGFSLLSEPTDPVNGIYATGSYVTFNVFGIGATNSYYGIRRFPYAPIAFTGGPGNRPFNPLTFKDIDPAQANISDGAYPPSSPFAGNPANEVHNAGEVWCSELVEVRAKLIGSTGGNVAAGNLKTLQFVTDGMKLAPLSPTFLQERDAIIAGAQASGTNQDVADIWAGFAARGMGFSARQNSGSFSVVEAFDPPNLVQTQAITISDAGGNNNGHPDPGETISLSIPLTNLTGTNATGVTLQIVGQNTFTVYGNIANGQTVSNSLVSYTIPANTPCGSSIILTINVNSNLGPVSFTRSITVGAPTVTATQNFDNVTAPALPSGWTTTQSGAGVGFVTVTNSADTTPNSVFTPDLTTTGGGAEITSPAFPISVEAGTISFRHKYNTEAGWDGGVLEISIGGGAFQDIIAAGGTFITNGYNGALGAGVGNPLANRNAWNGDSGGYILTTAQLPAAANGQMVRFRWRFGADDNTVGSGANPGWNVDTISISGDASCSIGTPTTRSRADFDGDGKTDISVFRAGAWYVQRSTAGFAGVQWGAAGDTAVPGDYDGDNKTDYAIFRPTAVAGVPDFYIINSATNTFSGIEWGNPGDLPVIGDYTGDGKADFAVVRPATYTWYILPSSGGGSPIIGTVGQVCDRPVVGDFDGDGKADIAGIQGATWFIRNSSTNIVTATQWGLSSDKFVPADYDNDNKDDLAIFRDGNWYVRKSTDGQLLSIAFGQAGDVPVPGDYDGDGADDAAVFRNGNWYILGTTGGFQTVAFGLTGDTPIPSRYLP